MAFYTGKKKKNSACFEKGRRKKKKQLCKEDLWSTKRWFKNKYSHSIRGKHWPVFSLLLIYFIFELSPNSTLIHQGEKQPASSKSASNLWRTKCLARPQDEDSNAAKSTDEAGLAVLPGLACSGTHACNGPLNSSSQCLKAASKPDFFSF